MKMIKRLFSVSLVMTMICLSTVCVMASSMDSGINVINIDENNMYVKCDEYTVILCNEKNLLKANELSRGFKYPVFVNTNNLDINQLMKDKGIYKTHINTAKIQNQDGLRFKGYLLYNNGTCVSPWYVENTIDDDRFVEYLEEYIGNDNNIFNGLSNKMGIESNNSSINAVSGWSDCDSWSYKITYEEGSVGYSGVLYKSKLKGNGGQKFIIDVVPKGRTTYKTYQWSTVKSEINCANAKVLDWSPAPRTNYTTSISFSLPFTVAISYSSLSDFKIERTAGGVGDTFTEWKYSAHNNVSQKSIKAVSGITFRNNNTSNATLKTTVGGYITFRTLDNPTGINKNRTVNYNSSFSS